MTLKVAVISKQTIKPSSPTPPHLNNFKLSRLDQYNPPIPLSVILFYSTANDHKPADHLKTSLSQTLSYFYPLAGRLNDDNQIIDCNDEGVNFFETQVNDALLNQVLEDPLREELEQLIPTDNFYGQGPKVVLSVQTNMFDCGGMALAVTISHKVADASSLAFFLTVWSEVSRGDKVTLHPIFNMSTIFPPKVVPYASWTRKKLVAKRFVFDSVNVAALKAKCSNKSYVEHPTRVEAVSALIWRCTMNVLRMRPDQSPPKSASVVNVSVNLRPRMTPPLLSNSFGNSAIVTLARSSTTETKHSELQCLVAQLRGAIRKVDADYVREFDIDDWFGEMIASYMNNGGESETYTYSILCKFPFYQLDFGWGKPTWACPLMVDMNLIQMVDTKCGQGIEAWVALSKEDMARFESEPDLIAFTVARGQADGKK